MHAVRGLFAVTAVSVFVGMLFFPQTAGAATIVKPANNLGLVGYWSFNEGTSTKATDFSGNGNTGTLTNMAAPATATSGWGNGKLGGGLNFDGVNDYMSLGTSASLQPSNLTYCTWVKRTVSWNSLTGLVLFWAKANGNYTSNGWYMEVTSSRAMQLAVNGAAINLAYVNIAPDAFYPLNQWTHVCSTFTPSGYAIYKNGVLQTIASVGSSPSITSTADTKYVGINSPGYNNHIPVVFDETRIYSRALSATEVTSLYNTGAQKLNASQNTTSSTLDQGLVGLWSFDGKDMNGTTAYDRSGSGNNGTLTNGPVTTVGKIGQSLSFDGVNDYVAFTSPVAGTPSQVTVGAWIYTSSPPTFKVAVSVGSSIWIGTYNNKWAFITANGQLITSLNNATAGWHYIAGVYDSSTAHLYVDGIEVTSSTRTIGSASGASRIGDFSGTGFSFPGKIDEVRIYNRALSASEIKSLYNRGTATVNASRNVTGSSLDTGLVGLWSFDGKDMNGTTTVYDRSGNGNNGTLTNGPTPAIGKMGQALRFDGVNDYVNISPNTAIPSSGPVTVSAWINYTPGTGNNLNWFKKGTTDGYGLYIDNISRLCVITYGVINWCPGIGIASDTWHHIVFTFDGTAQSVYEDGIFIASTNNGYNTATGNNATIGTNFTGTEAGYFKGKIDEVRVYNRALSATEITALYNLGK